MMLYILRTNCPSDIGQSRVTAVLKSYSACHALQEVGDSVSRWFTRENSMDRGQGKKLRKVMVEFLSCNDNGNVQLRTPIRTKPGAVGTNQ